MRKSALVCFLVLASFFGVACKGGEKPSSAETTVEEAPKTPTAAPENGAQPASSKAAAEPQAEASNPKLAHGLLLAYSQFEVENGKATAKPGPARLELLTQEDGEWKTRVIEDPDSNVFHKAMVLSPKGQPAGILTLGGSGAYVKLWHLQGGEWKPKTLWTEKFGGKFDRMRDAELADLYGEGTLDIAVATHDQGVVAVLRQKGDDWEVVKLDRKKDTFVHEIEIGDLDSDGVLEVYATPSDPNKLDAEAQHGEVVRYIPKKGGERKVVADLGDRHAKEILVDDIDGDGKDELYVAVEAKTEGSGSNLRLVEPVEIRRYDANTPVDAKQIIATIPDRLSRFLTAGDVDGDGKKEIVVASFSKGLWLLRPGKDPSSEWGIESIDRDSGGFEHASILLDLDEDGQDELYVAADQQGELRRYVWKNGRPKREVIHRRDIPMSMMTWNITAVPLRALQP
jgi:hypothetical protein